MQQHRVTWGDRCDGTGEVLRRQKWEESEGLQGMLKRMGLCPVHTRANTFYKKNHWGQSYSFEIVAAMCKVDWRREIMEAVVQWEIMRLWTKKGAEQTISRGVAEAELTGQSNWLDVVAWEKEESRRTPRLLAWMMGEWRCPSPTQQETGFEGTIMNSFGFVDSERPVDM